MTEITLSEAKEINISLSQGDGIQVELGSELVMMGTYEEYTGTYAVTPKAQEQTLFTADKYVRNNITVKEIPYAEVSNSAGGNTVIIG